MSIGLYADPVNESMMIKNMLLNNILSHVASDKTEFSRNTAINNRNL